MDNNTRERILNIITSMVESKLQKATKESEYSPFFEAFFSRSTILQASILHSFYTSFGLSVYEQIAVALAESAGYQVKRQYTLVGAIDAHTESLIAGLMQRPADKMRDVAEIRRVIQPVTDSPIHDRDKIVDIYIQKPDGNELLFDITTVKPSKKEFDVLRLKLLRWYALRFSVKQDAIIETYIGIPFNPYHPQPYARWTAGKLDPSEVCVQNELWAKFAGYDVFPELLEIFNQAGEEMRDKVRAYLDSL